MQNHQQHKRSPFPNQENHGCHDNYESQSQRGHQRGQSTHLKPGILGSQPSLSNLKEGPPAESGSYSLMTGHFDRQRAKSNLQVNTMNQ